MSKSNMYLFVSVPSSITPSGHKDDAIRSLQKAVNESYGTVLPLSIPEFKIGTLDALIQQSEELAKLEGMCEGVVSKVGDTLKNILDGDEEKMAQHKSVNDKPLDQYLRTFSWNKVKYRADKSLAELIDLLQRVDILQLVVLLREARMLTPAQEASSIDTDVRSKYNQYNQIKTNLQNLTRKQTGSLATKSLVSVVNPNLLVQSSDYIETHLVAVPNSSIKDFLKSYETISPMVVPRSANGVASDDEYTLYTVTTFKKYSAEFLHKAREKKWVPRDFKFKEGGKEEEAREVDRVGGEEKRVWGETLRLGRTAWSEGVMVLIHVLVLRVFVETVLRYGLPLDFVSVLVKTTPKQSKKARAGLDTNFAYLAGNAFGKDKKGRPKKDDSSLTADMQAAGQGGEGAEYSAYVCYELEVE